MAPPPSLPLLATAMVVCRECLPGYDVDSLSHVVGLVDGYLDSFSSNWTVPRACNAGLSVRALEYLCSRDPAWEGGQDVAYIAVKKNHLHVLQWLNERYPDRTSWGSLKGRCLLNKAAELKHLSVVQWLHANRREKCTTFAMSIAASNGDLAMVQWLHENRREGCTKQAMDDAAENGHLAVVEWLHSNRREGCTEDAMDDAAANGHLAVVRFLHENRREGCTSAAMNQAAANGHLETVKWLRENRKEGQPGAALRFAAEKGQLSVVEWLYDVVREQRRSESCIRGAARAAMEAGHAEVARELEQKLKRQRHDASPGHELHSRILSSRRMTSTAQPPPVLSSVLLVTRECLPSPDEAVQSRIAELLNGLVDTFSSRFSVRRACRKKSLFRRALEYLAGRDPDWGHGSKIAENAVVDDRLHVIQWVGECYPDRTVWSPLYEGSLMDTAAELGRLSILQWLHACRSEGCTTAAMDLAAKVGNLEVVQWLHRYRGEGCTKKAMDEAAAHGHLAMVEWLHSNRDEGCTKKAICSAATNGHLAVVRFLLENRREVCTSDAMRYAAANGHLEIVQWLYANRGDCNVGVGLRYAAENGRVEVVEWLYWYVRDQRRGDLCIRDAIQIALKAGEKKAAKLLERKLKQEASRAKPQQREKKRRRRS